MPGEGAKVLPAGYAQKIPAGSEILFQVHYAKTGKEESDSTSLGFIFSKDPSTKQIETRWVTNHYFRIPAIAQSHEVRGCYTFDKDVDIISTWSDPAEIRRRSRLRPPALRQPTVPPSPQNKGFARRSPSGSKRTSTAWWRRSGAVVLWKHRGPIAHPDC